jgi:hypothetical protein
MSATIIMTVIRTVLAIMERMAVVKNHSCMKYRGPLNDVLTLILDYFICKLDT